jgi:transcriptional regulator with GAF, ATPase, and Fis domain
MLRLRIKISESKKLGFLEEIIKDSKLTDLEIVNENEYDLLISDSIPDSSKLFIVVWEKHDINEIEKKIASFKKDNYLCMRGIFLAHELALDPSAFIDTIDEIKKEIGIRENLKEKAKEIKSEKQFIEIGSLVNIGKRTGDAFAGEFSKPRFTTLFIDKPMLQLMSNLGKLLLEMRQSINSIEQPYKKVLDKIHKTSGIDEKKDCFDENLVEDIFRLQEIAPVRIEPILLTGETGVGKTLIARWIYHQAKLPGSFQEINSSGLPLDLLESELFGHVKGAWSFAYTTKAGKALLALGGALFLDEIGDMPLEIQPKVMKFIEEKTFTPDGWSRLKPLYSPLLVIAATNKKLDKEVEKGKFRGDLYARFKNRVHIPSIEERKSSLNVIVDLILQSILQKDVREKIKYVSNAAIEKLKQIEYKENFRGLERVIREAVHKTLEHDLDIILPEVLELDS